MHSQAAFDVWTIVHHLYGAYFFGVCQLSLQETLALAMAWEMFENTPMGIAAWQDTDYAGNSVRNAAVDVLATASGWLLAATTGPCRSFF